MERDTQALNFDELLAHAGWIQSLARSLVRDPATADDLVQDTWVAAMRGQRRGPVRPWLATILRNLWRERDRSETSRAHRERQVASEEQLPSGEELTERVERQRLLAESVMQLDEPYRTVVILRYYEGLSAAKIARRQDQPAERVRWRLRRALEILRERLHGRHGRDWVAWCSFLLPLAERGAPIGAPIAPAATTVSLGALLMSAKTLSVLSIVLASVVGLVWWTSGEPDTPAPSSGPIERAAQLPDLDAFATQEPARIAGGPARTLLEGSIAARALGWEAPAAPTSTASVQGRVTAAENGAALEGVLVCIYKKPSAAEALEARTEPDGSYRIEGLEPDSYRVSFLSSGRVPLNLLLIDAEAEEEHTFDAELSLGNRFEVEVVDAVSGSAVFDAEVVFIAGDGRAVSKVRPGALRFHGVSARSSRAGRAELRGLASGAHQVAVQADGYSTWTGEVMARDEHGRLRVELVGGASLEGRVVLASGAPAAGARVFVNAESYIRSLPVPRLPQDGVLVAEDGSYRVDCLPAGSYYVVAVAPDASAVFHGADGELETVELREGQREWLDLSIPAPARLRGRVVDPDGRPVSGVYVYVSWGDFKPRGAGFFDLERAPGTKELVDQATHSDEEGRFEIASLRASWRPLSIATSKRGYRRAELELEPRPGELIERDIVLEPLAAEIAGRLSTPEGDPVEDVSVGAWELLNSGRGEFFVTQSEPDGSYRLQITEEIERLSVYPILHDEDPWVSEPEERIDVRGGSQGIDFVLHPKHWLGGVLVDEQGQAVRGFHVTLLDPSSGEIDRLRDADLGEGRFRVPLDPARSPIVCFTAPELEPHYLMDVRAERELRIEMRRPPALRGRVIDSEGRGVEGALICMATLDAASFLPGSEHAPVARSAQDGAFTLRGVPDQLEGHLLVASGRDDAPPLLRVPLDSIRRDAAIIELPESSEIIFALAHATGEPAQGVVVVLDAAGWPLEPRAEPTLKSRLDDAGSGGTPLVDGRARLTLAAGDYTLVFLRDGRAEVEYLHTFAFQVAGEDARLSFRVP